jgi:hypothetical protein
LVGASLNPKIHSDLLQINTGADAIQTDEIERLAQRHDGQMPDTFAVMDALVSLNQESRDRFHAPLACRSDRHEITLARVHGQGVKSLRTQGVTLHDTGMKRDLGGLALVHAQAHATLLVITIDLSCKVMKAHSAALIAGELLCIFQSQQLAKRREGIRRDGLSTQYGLHGCRKLIPV